jgi:hypothetical protein
VNRNRLDCPYYEEEENKNEEKTTTKKAKKQVMSPSWLSITEVKFHAFQTST